MIKIDIEMPNSCYDCPLMDPVSFSCLASGSDPGFVVFCGLPNSYNWDEWKEKASSQRDPRCPMHDEHEVCVNCPMNPIRPTWQQGKAYCGQCGKRIPLKINANYCHKCGREINWLP